MGLFRKIYFGVKRSPDWQFWADLGSTDPNEPFPGRVESIRTFEKKQGSLGVASRSMNIVARQECYKA